MSWTILFCLVQVFCVVLSTKTHSLSARGNYSNQSPNGVVAPLTESEPEVEPSAEPEGEGSEAEKWPEPGPRWNEAYDKWGAAWEIHIYGFALCFFFVFVYALYYVIVNILDGLRKKYLSVCLNVMMVICGFTRTLVLALDPYHQGTFVDTPLILMRILWSLTDPCLTAADSLCILSLTETYKLSIAPQRFQRPSTIIPVIIVHFSFVLISDLVVSEFLEAKAMLLFCQIFFIVWCATLGFAYFFLGYKLDKVIFKSDNVDNEISQEGRWYIYLIYASGLSNLLTSCVYIYSAADVFGVYSDVTFVDAWPWWSLQTCLRITELVAAILVFTVSAKRVQPTQHEAETAVDPAGTARKRKQSMFSALRSQRDKRADSYANETYQSVIMELSGFNMASNKLKETRVNVTSDEGQKSRESLHENNLIRKDSMFTVLTDKAKLASENI